MEDDFSPDDETSAGEPPRLGRFRRLALNAGLALASLLVAALAAEMAVRVLAPQQLILKRPDVWQPADTLGWTHRPGVSTTINTGAGPVSLFTDGKGYRVAAGGRVEADTRILLLGDSFMEALQVEYPESLPGRLEARLARSMGRPVAVRNTAVGGWSPGQYLAQARRSLGEESLDLVLVSLYVANDVMSERPGPVAPRTPEEVHHLRLPRSLAGEELVDAVLYPINDFLEVRSHLFVLFKRQADQLLMRLGLTAAYFPDEFRKATADTDRWAVTADVCREIAELAGSRNLPTVFVLVPAAYQVQTDAFRRYVQGFDIDPDSVDLEQPNRLLGRSLRERGLTVVDPLPELRRAAESGEPLYGSVDRHLSTRGHAMMARVLEPVLADRLAGTPYRAAGRPEKVAADGEGGGRSRRPGRAVPSPASEDGIDEGGQGGALREDDQRSDEEHDRHDG